MGVVPATADQPAAGPRNATLSGLLRAYFPVILALAVALPLTVYATIQTWAWLGTTFPGFLLMENAVVPTVGAYDWPSDKATLFHSQVVAVDNRAVRTSADVFEYVSVLDPGTDVEYTLWKDGRSVRVTLPTRRFTFSDYLQTYGILLLFGCTNLILGLVVGFLQPRTAQARLFLLHTCVAGLYAITAVFLHHPDFHWLNRLCLTAECFAPATFIHLALFFPVERQYTGVNRIWPVLPYVLSAMLIFTVLWGFDQQPAALIGLHLTYTYLAISLLFFAGMMAFVYWENRELMVRPRIRAILPGVILAAGVQFFVFINNALSGRNVPVQFGLLTPIPYYASLAYAIAKHDLFGIDRVVRLTFVYTVLSVIVTGSYAAVLQIPANLVPGFGASSQTILSVGFVLVLALALDPLRHVVQNMVDHAFYRARLDYRATISELSELLTTLLDAREIIAQVTRVVRSAMQLESTSVALLQPDTPGIVWRRTADDQLTQRTEGGLPAVAETLQRSPDTFQAAQVSTLVQSEPEKRIVRACLDELGAIIVLPLVFRGHPIGILALGPKQSGQPFDREAVELLRTLANQTAIALQNAHSYQELEDLNRDLDAKVQQQTEELRISNRELSHAYDELKSTQAQLVQSEKMASLGQLVAGVAHELNNPASFVYGGLSNLTEYLNRFIEVIEAYQTAAEADENTAKAVAAVRRKARLEYLLHETPTLLRICTEGSERIKKIVDDLRVFARADGGARMPTDVTEGIDSTIGLLGGRLQPLGVRIEKNYDDVPEIDANAGQLNQVWMNLLSNAIDAVEGHPEATIRVTVRHRVGGESCPPETDSCLEVVVSDNGSGIKETDRARIFEPFFSTKAIGQGTGLGLSIAYGAVKSHGGAIEVESTPGSGTEMTVHLPFTVPKERQEPPGSEGTRANKAAHA
jgi:signal transduction histidine kinase